MTISTLLGRKQGRSTLRKGTQNFLEGTSTEAVPRSVCDSCNQSGAAVFQEPRLTSTQPLLPAGPPRRLPGDGLLFRFRIPGPTRPRVCVSVCVSDRPVPRAPRKPWAVQEMPVSPLLAVALDSSEKDPTTNVHSQFTAMKGSAGSFFFSLKEITYLPSFLTLLFSWPQAAGPFPALEFCTDTPSPTCWAALATQARLCRPALCVCDPAVGLA